MSTVSRLYPWSCLAALVLVGCSSQSSQPLKKGESRRCGERGPSEDAGQREGQRRPGAGSGQTFESQKLAPTVENVCSVLAVAQQESNYQADPAVPGLNKIARKRSTAALSACIFRCLWCTPR